MNSDYKISRADIDYRCPFIELQLTKLTIAIAEWWLTKLKF